MSDSTRVTPASKPAYAPGRRDLPERIMAALAVLTLVIAWVYGYISQSQATDLQPYLPRIFPTAAEFKLSGDIYVALHRGADGSEAIVGYAKTGEAGGYAGPVTVLVGIEPTGQVAGVEVIAHKETPTFFQLITGGKFFDGLIGRSYADPLTLGQDVDAVTGATFTSRAIVDGLRQAARSMAVSQLGATPVIESKPIGFGAPEIILIALYIVGFFAHRYNSPAKKWLRWGTLLAGMFLLGFWLNQPLTITNIATLLSGYWPEWQSNLYWYLMIGGIIFIATAEGKNAYCTWFCPFGAVQECIGAIGGAKRFTPKRWKNFARWLQRGLAWLALMFALTLRRPGVATYEPFGTLFDFKGTAVQWLLLVVVLLMSLAVFRPWCNFLCPLDPVFSLITSIRRWSIDLWRRKIRLSSKS